MRTAAHPLPLLLATASILNLCACSLVSPSTRPDPEANHVRCALEYRPSSGTGDAPDLLFLAWSSPYDPEEFLYSLPDQLVHSLFAPGRHLQQALRVEGASCTTPLWPEGTRLPTVPDAERSILCRRNELEAVTFHAETRWGACARALEAGDATPRPQEELRRVLKLPELGETSRPAAPRRRSHP